MNGLMNTSTGKQMSSHGGTDGVKSPTDFLCLFGGFCWFCLFVSFFKAVAMKKGRKQSSVQAERTDLRPPGPSGPAAGIESSFSEDVVIQSNTRCCPS